MIRNVYEYFSVMNYMSNRYIEALENKFHFDENHQSKIDDNLSIKYRNKIYANKDNSSNGTVKKLKDATMKITANQHSKNNKGKTLIQSNLLNWFTGQCFIKGINLLNNLITLPSKFTYLINVFFVFKKVLCIF